MIYSVSGRLTAKNKDFAVIEASGIGFKISISEKTFRHLPKINNKSKLFCAMAVSRENLEIFGFLTEAELKFFNLFVSVNGIGPKAAIKILGVAKLETLLSAIKEGRPDILARAGGVGSKKASRLVLEIKDKIKGLKIDGGKETAEKEEVDLEIKEILKNLGYRKNEIEKTMKILPEKISKREERIRLALKFLASGIRLKI